jgi:hypothetical protein
MFREQGVDVQKSYQEVNAPARQIPTARPEMRGPQSSDIDNILSGLKTRTVNIHENQGESASGGGGGDDSMISISSLKDMQGATMPKRSNRRKDKSEKNTISLDI